MSVGIVAFSEAQQSEIERVCEGRCIEEPEFEKLYEAACEREEDDQFVGLFIKNLENVQGDERDVIIMSVCYGYDSKRKMRMNFGPINQSGGEKRLNVVFSRAKKHMVLVSSITHTAITNDYNDGANCLKRYLRYAQARSIGDSASAERVLEECCPDAADVLARQPSTDPVVRSLADWLQQQGYQVDEQIGSSRFRCDIAVRGTRTYASAFCSIPMSIIRTPILWSSICSGPAVLQAFGWRLIRVLARDWLEEREIPFNGVCCTPWLRLKRTNKKSDLRFCPICKSKDSEGLFLHLFDGLQNLFAHSFEFFLAELAITIFIKQGNHIFAKLIDGGCHAVFFSGRGVVR